ncbi:hypothetical protein [Pedobacter steynii]
MKTIKYLFMVVTMAQLLVSTTVFAQEQDSTTRKAAFTWSSLWSNNANYYGQTASEALPFLYTDIKMSTKAGWYVSAGGYQLLKEGNFPSELHLGTGFEFSLNKTVSINLGYTRSFYSKDSPLLQASNPNNLSSEIGFSHLFQTDIGGDYNFGKENDVFLSLTNSKTVSLHSFTDKDLLYIKPTITLTAGTQRFYTTYLEEKNVLVCQAFWKVNFLLSNNRNTKRILYSLRILRCYPITSSFL